jgi:hypothetical protein
MAEKDAYNYENDYAAVDCVPLLNCNEDSKDGGTTETNPLVFPGFRRAVAGPAGPPKDHVLIRTAGNALQAVPRSYFEQTITKSNVLGVPVPPNSRGGDRLVVMNPNNRKLVQVTVPHNCNAPGQLFFVEMPVADAPAAGVMAEQPSHELELGSDPVVGPEQHGFVLVQVPEGQTPGSRLQVSLADGRTFMAVVPSDPSIREFYMKVPDSNGEMTTGVV